LESPALLSVRDISKRYGEIRAIDRVGFDAEPGETLALIGASGCGKTTTLKIINRLIEPDSGEVFLNSKATTSFAPHLLRREIGYVFQEIGLFPHMSVADNIAVTLRLLDWETARIEARIDTLLDMMRLDSDRHRAARPADLSGGQRQRVGIARALAAEPGLVLMDEPFGALDPITRDELRNDFKAIQNRLGFTAVIVTHDMAEAALLGDRIIVMDQGRVLQDDTPERIIDAPATPQVEALLAAPMREAAKFARMGTAP